MRINCSFITFLFYLENKYKTSQKKQAKKFDYYQVKKEKRNKKSSS